MAVHQAGARSFYLSWQGTEEMRKRMQQLGPAGANALAKGVVEEAELFMEDVKRNHVPRDLGGLVGSGFVRGLKRLGLGFFSVRFGFGGPAAPYAWAIHENPRAGQTGGLSPKGRKYKHWAKVGHWKYLEKPMGEWVHTLNVRLAKRVGDVWHKTLGGKK